ncbi:aminopeptidase [Marinobacter salicampi]|uniref:aminopeptidase n=1 Tax=Marinobacter salicampi TaxID=435907 RepID=UPI00140C6A56|nr:aminopeptidase [Marinobacter salicampi]
MQQLSQIYLFSLLILSLGGCTTVNYYTQAVGGQMSLLWHAEPVTDLIADPEVDPELKDALAVASDAREFARHRLALPVGGSFRDFVYLERPYVVVNLMAVPEFSLDAHQWCYPLIGCQSYRGYFNPDAARKEQEVFEARGYDTLLGGVTAYSTLGWFPDPLHSGFTNLDQERMVALIIHELSHQVIYIADDTAFNESYATAVELEGLKLWLAQSGHDEGFARALARLANRDATLVLAEAAVADLEQLYDQEPLLPRAKLRKQKQQILATLRKRYLALAATWSEPGPFGTAPDPFNNAHVALFRQYNQFVPGFRQLLRDHGYDFAAFHEAVIELSELAREPRTNRLISLGQRFDENL